MVNLKENLTEKKVSRRNFLKGSAATAAVLGVAATDPGSMVTDALATADSSSSSGVETMFLGACRGNCGGDCQQIVTVRDGNIVKVEPAIYPEEDKDYQRICARGYANIVRRYDPNRIKYPMKRVGERGSGEWEQITWEEAIDTMAEKFQSVIDNYGPSSLALWSCWGTSNAVISGANGAGASCVSYGRFTKKLGMTRFGPGSDYATIWSAAHLGQSVVQHNSPEEYYNSKTILIMGANPAISAIHMWHFVQTARENGAKVINIDPQFTETSAQSDQHIYIKPATDAILVCAMCNYIIDNNWIDVDFLTNKSVAPFLLKADGTYLRESDIGIVSEANSILVWDQDTQSAVAKDAIANVAIWGEYTINGEVYKTTLQESYERIKEYTVEKAEELTGIDADVIKELTRTYTLDGPSSLFIQYGLGHHYCSHKVYKNLALLISLTGQVAKPGAGWGATFFTQYGDGISLNAAAYTVDDEKPCLSICGMYLPGIMETKKWGEQDLDIQAAWIVSGNPLGSEAGRGDLIEAASKIDFVVCSDVILSGSAKYADMVLPVAHAFEFVDIGSYSANPYYRYYQKISEPLYESKSDMDALRLLADKMGIGEIYDRTDEEFVELLLDTEENIANGITFEAFQQATPVRRPTTYKGVYAENGVFTTTTGRYQFHIENPSPRNDYGQPIEDSWRFPGFENSLEVYPGNPMLETYPIAFTGTHFKFNNHSSITHNPWFRELETEPWAKISTTDAAARGIAQGDHIRVFNDRGYAVVKAIVDEGVMPGVIVTTEGWHPDQYISGHIQDLPAVDLHPYDANSAFYEALCDFEKYEGGAE